MDHPLLNMIAGRRGHFRMESGYHSELWFELGPLFTTPERVRPYVMELARRLARHRPDAICGPEEGGATLAVMLGVELGLPSYAARRFVRTEAGLFPVEYHIAPADRAALCGRRIAIVDDAVSAGSAVRGTHSVLLACGAEPVACGALLVFSQAVPRFAAERGLGFEGIAHLEFSAWTPDACPLCRQGRPLESVADTV